MCRNLAFFNSESDYCGRDDSPPQREGHPGEIYWNLLPRPLIVCECVWNFLKAPLQHFGRLTPLPGSPEQVAASSPAARREPPIPLCENQGCSEAGCQDARVPGCQGGKNQGCSEEGCHQCCPLCPRCNGGQRTERRAESVWLQGAQKYGYKCEYSFSLRRTMTFWEFFKNWRAILRPLQQTWTNIKPWFITKLILSVKQS